MKYFTLGLLILALALPFALTAMQAPETPIQKQQLWIKNKTANKVTVEFATMGAKVVPLPLYPGKEHVFNEPEKLTELYIEPYGQVRGWLSSSVLTGGFLKYNYVDRAKSELYDASQTTPPRNIVMVIEPSPMAPSASSWLRSAAQDLLPFNVRYKRTGPYVPQIPALLKEYFPEVNRAIDEDRSIVPHYFLGLKENASPQQVEAAYKSMHSQLTSIVESNLPTTQDERDFYRQALNFLDHAYRSIVGGEAEKRALTDLIQEHLADIGGTTETIPTLYDTRAAASQPQ